MRGAKGRWHGDLAMLGEGSQVAPTIGCRGAAAPYQALRTTELDETRQPNAFLVAYAIPETVGKFCARHGVRFLEIQPNTTVGRAVSGRKARPASRRRTRRK